MANPSTIAVFDRALLKARRDRAAEGAGEYDFLFRDVAQSLSERLDLVKKEFPRVLDLGSASGALTGLLKQRKGTEAVISADLSARAPGVTLVCDAEYLPFADHSLDAVVSCLDLHWVNDLPGALVQIRRALKPDGLFLAALLGGETLTELRGALMEAELAVTSGASPRVSPFAGLQDMSALMQRAGFALPVVDNDYITVNYADPFRLMRDLRGMGAANATFGRLKKPTRRSVLMEAARLYREKSGDAEGHIPATFEVIYLIGWAPHESQQQPLKPGSAKTRLADALGVSEVSAEDKAIP